MHATVLIAAIMGALGPSYGPGVHVREADLYAEMHPEWGGPDLQRFIRLGAVFPDLRSGGVALPVNSHEPSFGAALIAVAEADGTPWKRAFAHGYRLHTASDTVAQLMYLPWLNASSDLQQVNLFGRKGVSAVGDNELFIEGYGDLHTGDLQGFVDTAYAFLFDAPGELEEVVMFFLQGLAVVAGEALDTDAVRAAIDAFWSSVESTLAGLDPGFVAALLEEAHTLTVSEVIGLLSSGLFAELLGSVPGTDGELVADTHEMARLEAHPAGAAPGAFFSAYEDTFSLAAVAMMAEPAYDNWPWYRDTPIVAAIVQGFALGRPDVWAHRPEVLIFDARFEDEAGVPVARVTDADGGRLRASSELFLAFDTAPVSVTLEVVERQGPSLSEVGAQAVVASAEGVVSYGPQRTSLVAEFIPDTDQPSVFGYAMRWRVEGDEAPFLETDWVRYAVFADAPLFRDSYAQGVASELPMLPEQEGLQAAGPGWVSGHTVLPQGHRGIAARVHDGGALSVVGHPGGGFMSGPLAPGARSLWATAEGYRGGPVEVMVLSGRGSVSRIDLRAVPRADAPLWSPSLQEVSVELDVDHFETAPASLSLTLVLSGTEDVVGTWAGAPPSGPIDIVFTESLQGGAAVVVRAQADLGEVTEADVFMVDGTPPTSPEVSWAGNVCVSPFEVTLKAEDLEAPVVGFEVRLAQGDWQPVDGAGDVSLVGEGVAGVPVTLEARAANAAGWWSEVSTTELCIPADGEVVDAVGAKVEVADSAQEMGPSEASDADTGASLDVPEGSVADTEAGCHTGGQSSSPLGLLGPLLMLLSAARSLAQRHRAGGRLLERT
ncbi:MAG: hypothetical protein ACPGU1_18545 [Myxococcota bacterium]